MDWVIYCCLEGMGKSKGDLMNKKIIALIIIVLIAVLAVVGYMMYPKNMKSNNTTQMNNTTNVTQGNNTTASAQAQLKNTQNNQTNTQSTNNQKSTVNGVPYGQTEPVYGSVVYWNGVKYTWRNKYGYVADDVYKNCIDHGYNENGTGANDK